jgi:hypothetical protein
MVIVPDIGAVPVFVPVKDAMVAPLPVEASPMDVLLLDHV